MKEGNTYHKFIVHLKTIIMKHLCFILLTCIALGCSRCGKTQSIRISGSPISHVLPNSAAYMIVFSGESNAGGEVLNTSATSGELAPRTSVKILNNNTLLFEDLDIGTNNNIGHRNMTCCTTHGWELGLANSVDSNTISNPAYLVKTGQGGSIITQWATTGVPAYRYWDSLTKRVDTAKVLLTALNSGVAPSIYLWYSQGINDALIATDTATWKINTKAHFASIRARYGTVPIFITLLPPASFGDYNLAINTIAGEVSECYTITTSDLTMLDSYHWSYAGMKIIAQRMIASLKAHYGR